jgi:hypothetical protein
MKTIGNIILVILLLILVSPIVIVLIIIFVPYSIIRGFIDRRNRKKELEDALFLNDGKILFLYGEYHEFDFLTYFETHHSGIQCLEVENHYNSDVFTEYLVKDMKSKSLPQLVKIDGENILKREHYNSFKHYIRRTNNVDGFFELIDSSIKNLGKFPYKQV